MVCVAVPCCSVKTSSRLTGRGDISAFPRFRVSASCPAFSSLPTTSNCWPGKTYCGRPATSKSCPPAISTPVSRQGRLRWATEAEAISPRRPARRQPRPSAGPNRPRTADRHRPARVIGEERVLPSPPGRGAGGEGRTVLALFGVEEAPTGEIAYIGGAGRTRVALSGSGAGLFTPLSLFGHSEGVRGFASSAQRSSPQVAAPSLSKNRSGAGPSVFFNHAGEAASLIARPRSVAPSRARPSA